MRFSPGSRKARKIRERLLERGLQAERILRHPLSDPRVGDDRRQQERRVRIMTQEELEDWLRLNGISGGDRRQGERRQRDRRR